MNENQLQTLLNAINTLQDLGKVAYFNKGNFNSQTEYEINDVVSYNGSSYVSLVNNNRGNLPTNTAFWSVVASKGDKGDTGKAFVIEKTYSTIEDMVDDYDNMEINDYVMIQGDVEAQENATLWTKREVESTPYRWTYLADFSGASGITGATPNIQIGTVTEGNQPSVTRRAGSTNENPILDFVLKTGAKGDTGATGNGISSVSKTSTSGLTDIYTIAYTNGGSDTFNVVNGKGIVSIEKTGSVDTVDTYTITYNDDTTSTFEVTNGEVTQAQLDETNEEVERANMVYNALPKVSGEGTELALDNTAECPVYEVGLRPSELQQKTTTGKNLSPTLLFPNATNNGIALTKNSNNEIVLNETATAQANFNTSYLEIPSGLSQVTLSGGTSNVSFAIVTYTSDKTYISTSRDSGSGVTYTIPSNAVYYVSNVRVASGTTLNDYVLKAQMESGSSASSYEPPIGITPNPDYPQDIHVATGENSVKVGNKNLVNISDKSGSLNNEFSRVFVTDYNLIAGATYTLSLDANVSITPFRLSVGCGIDTYTTDILIKRDLENGKIYITFTPTVEQLKNGNKLFIRCPRYASATNTTYELSNIQLELNSTATPYVLHKEQTYPLSLGDLEYCKIGDYEDEFFKNVVGSTYYDSTLVENKWYLKKNIGKVVLDGSETWTSGDTSPTGNYRCISTIIQNLVLRPSSANVKIPMYSNYYISKTYNQTYLREQGISIGSNGNLGIYDNNFVTNDISLYKAWLSTHNLIVYYPLATPTYTLLNNTLQTQLDNLSKAISYQDQTNVSQTNADLPFVVKMSAIRDMSGIFELIQE